MDSALSLVDHRRVLPAPTKGIETWDDVYGPQGQSETDGHHDAEEGGGTCDDADLDVPMPEMSQGTASAQAQ
jgi:hypothetical protein